MDYQKVQGNTPAREYVKCLFNRIGKELNIQANLLTCRDFKKQPYYGWALSIKGINWIYINYDRIIEDYPIFKKHGGIRFEGLSWRPTNSIGLALFYTIIHEYTHLMDSPVSMAGLSEENYFQILSPLGGRKTFVGILNKEPKTEEDIVKKATREAQIHDDLFFSRLRINVYRCGKILEELEKEAKG